MFHKLIKFKDKQISLIAGDTFRAAAVEQLSIWGQRNHVKVHTAPVGGDALRETIQ